MFFFYFFFFVMADIDDAVQFSTVPWYEVHSSGWKEDKKNEMQCRWYWVDRMSRTHNWFTSTYNPIDTRSIKSFYTIHKQTETIHTNAIFTPPWSVVMFRSVFVFLFLFSQRFCFSFYSFFIFTSELFGAA